MFYDTKIQKTLSFVVPDVVDPAVHAHRHEHVQVDPQREPVLGLLVTQPVHQSGFIDFGFQSVPQVSWYWTQNNKYQEIMICEETDKPAWWEDIFLEWKVFFVQFWLN